VLVGHGCHTGGHDDDFEPAAAPTRRADP
jgi:hypothetical protein